MAHMAHFTGHINAFGQGSRSLVFTKGFPIGAHHVRDTTHERDQSIEHRLRCYSEAELQSLLHMRNFYTASRVMVNTCAPFSTVSRTPLIVARHCARRRTVRSTRGDPFANKDHVNVHAHDAQCHRDPRNKTSLAQTLTQQATWTFIRPANMNRTQVRNQARRRNQARGPHQRVVAFTAPRHRAATESIGCKHSSTVRGGCVLQHVYRNEYCISQ
jgi:hypothetical protein